METGAFPPSTGIQLFSSVSKGAFNEIGSCTIPWLRKKIGSNIRVLEKREVTHLIKPDFFFETDASGGSVLMQQGRPIKISVKPLDPEMLLCQLMIRRSFSDFGILEEMAPLLSWFPILLLIKTDQQSLKYITEQKVSEGIQHKLM